MLYRSSQLNHCLVEVPDFAWKKIRETTAQQKQSASTFNWSEQKNSWEFLGVIHDLKLLFHTKDGFFIMETTKFVFLVKNLCRVIFFVNNQLDHWIVPILFAHILHCRFSRLHFVAGDSVEPFVFYITISVHWKIFSSVGASANFVVLSAIFNVDANIFDLLV